MENTIKPKFAINPPPDILYKYRPFDKKAVRILKKRELFFSDPITHFNDPFDCRLPVAFDGTADDWLARAKAATERAGFPFDESAARAQAHRMVEMKDANEKEWHEFLNTMSRQLLVAQGQPPNSQKRVGILSLSATWSDPLMWSHYADGHRGICFGFGTEVEPNFFYAKDRFLGQVDYPTDYPAPNAFRSQPAEQLQWTIFTKLPHWAYEKEWRVFCKAGGGPVHFSPAMLKRVVLGASISECARSKVLRLLYKWNPLPEILQARTKENRLEFARVTRN